MAADELEAWELSAMRDPRNWARPAAALVAGSAAGAALVLLRARRRAHSAERPPGMRLPALDVAAPSARCATSSARRASCSASAERRTARRRTGRRVRSV